MTSTDTLVADVDGARLAYSVTGDAADALVLVHGSWTSRHSWDLVVGGLSGRFRVVAYDRRGHSESSAPPGQGDFGEDVADLAALIEYLHLAPAWVTGNSSGAVVAVQLAAARPELVRGLVVHEPPLVGLLAAGSAEATAWAAVEDGPMAEVRRRIEAGDHAGAAERFVDDVALGPGSWAGMPEPLRATMADNAPTYLDEMRDPSWRTVDERALAGFAGPALVTGGGASPSFMAPVLDRLEELLPHVERCTFQQAGHIPHLTHPDEYVATLVAFTSQARQHAASARQ